jgi:hypothetical protein
MPSDQYFYKVGGIAALLGVPCLAIATFAHPMSASPADAHAAFAEYAADRFWVASHLLQLLGVVLITGGLIALSWRLRRGPAGVWAVLGGVGAVGALTLSGALQAVDGIALNVMVDQWASASPESQALLFESAVAVREIEIGLAGIVILFFGLTAVLYAGAFRLSADAPHWLGWLALLSGIAMLIAGVMYAYTGFSDRAMMVSMPASLLLMLWGIAVGIFLLRSSRPAPTA